MTAVIVSDVHLGSPDLDRKRFVSFLDSLPDGAELILNGDTLHVPVERLGVEDLSLLDRLLAEAGRRKLVWICGNHDEGFDVPGADDVIFCDDYVAGEGVFVIHGSQMMPLKPLLRLIMCFSRPLTIRIRGEYFMSARFIRSMPRVYRALQSMVAGNALRYAAKRSYRVIICGHLHEPADITIKGVRYLNTGTWTEENPRYVVVDGEEVSLVAPPSL